MQSLFYSQLADKFDSPHGWIVDRFEFHGPSEHTVNGQRFDVELQFWMSHDPSSTEPSLPHDAASSSAISILFSVDYYNAQLSKRQQGVIDSFFDKLNWTIDDLEMSQMTSIFDFDNRWIYKGSMTTPPCSTFVYWNVLSTVYPISQEHADQFKENGNFRNVQLIDEQDVMFVHENKFKFGESDYSQRVEWGVSLGLIGFILSLY